jgi:hypothetical protein
MAPTFMGGTKGWLPLIMNQPADRHKPWLMSALLDLLGHSMICVYVLHKLYSRNIHFERSSMQKGFCAQVTLGNVLYLPSLLEFMVHTNAVKALSRPVSKQTVKLL